MYASSNQIEISIAVLYGRILEQAAAFAKKASLSEEDITARLGTLLLLGTQGRAKDSVRVQSLRVQTPKLGKGVRKMEGRSSSRKSSSRKTKSVGKGGYWATMTKEERVAEMRRRIAKRKKAA
jgi:hypothetical protein